MSHNRIVGHTFNRRVNGDCYGTIKVKWNGRTKTVKWDCDTNKEWNQWNVDEDVLRYTVAYLKKIIQHFC